MSTNFEQGLDVAGNVSLTGNIVVGGNTISGDTDTDSVTFNADVSSHIIPDADKTYSLGTLTKRWDNIFGDALNLESGLSADSAVITNSVTAEEFISTSTGTPTLSSGSDIIINPAGQVNVTSAMEVTGNLLVQGVLSNLTNWSIVEVGGVLQFQNSVTNNTISLPSNVDGTVALTSDITTAETNITTAYEAYTDAAIANVGGGGVVFATQILTGSGTWTPQYNCPATMAVVGGGGGGGAAAAEGDPPNATARFYTRAGGGGSGGVVLKAIQCNTSHSYSYSCGSGGSGSPQVIANTGQIGSGNGSPGAGTTISGNGINISCGGGTAGTFTITGTNTFGDPGPSAGTGGSASGGDQNITGTDGVVQTDNDPYNIAGPGGTPFGVAGQPYTGPLAGYGFFGSGAPNGTGISTDYGAGGAGVGVAGEGTQGRATGQSGSNGAILILYMA